jgi:hypothetical protein
MVTAVFSFTLRPVLNGKPKDMRPVESDMWFLDVVCSLGKASPSIRDPPTHLQSVTVSYCLCGLSCFVADVLQCCSKSPKVETAKPCSCCSEQTSALVGY